MMTIQRLVGTKLIVVTLPKWLVSIAANVLYVVTARILDGEEMSRIKEATYEKCGECGATQYDKLITPQVIACEFCGRECPMDLGPERERQYLDVTVFHTVEQADHIAFCNWTCALKGLKKIKTNYFVNLPYLHYDTTIKGIRASDFWKAVREFK